VEKLGGSLTPEEAGAFFGRETSKGPKDQEPN
jgi:hypothetical protein